MLLAGVVACTEVPFKVPQPEGVKSLSAIPAKLHGTYQIEKNGTPSGKMVVEANGYRIENDEYDQAPEVFLLSDSVVIKNYKGYYFINVRNNSGSNHLTAIIIRASTARLLDRRKKEPSAPPNPGPEICINIFSGATISSPESSLRPTGSSLRDLLPRPEADIAREITTKAIIGNSFQGLWQEERCALKIKETEASEANIQITVE